MKILQNNKKYSRNRKQTQICLCLLLSLLFLSIACHSKQAEHGVSLKYVPAKHVPKDDSLSIITYSSTAVYPKHYPYKKVNHLPNNIYADTVLIHLVVLEKPFRILPLLPSDDGVLISFKKGKWQFKGDKKTNRENERMLRFYETLYSDKQALDNILEDSTRFNQFIQLCKAYPNSAAAAIYPNILKNFYLSPTQEKDSLQRLQLDSLLMPNNNPYQYLSSAIFPTTKRETLHIPPHWEDDLLYLHSSMVANKKRIALKKLWNKKHPEAIIGFFLPGYPKDSVSQKLYLQLLKQADSLRIPFVAYHLLQDSLSKDPLKKRTHKQLYIRIPDTLSLASLTAEKLNITQYPCYLRIDSLYHIKEKATSPKAILEYVKKNYLTKKKK